MASVHKPSGRKKYRIEFKDQFDAVRVTPGFRDKKASQEYARKLESDAQRIKAGLQPEHPDITGKVLGLETRDSRRKDFASAKDAYTSELQRLGRSATHLRDVKSILNLWQDRFGWKTLQDIEDGQVGELLRELSDQGRAARTQNQYRTILGGFLQFCIDQNWRESSNPAKKASRVKLTQATRKRLRRAFSEEELLHFLKTADAFQAGSEKFQRRWKLRRATLYSVAAYSGFRRSELKRLVKEDCSPDLERPRWHVPAERTKNGLAVNLPMTGECAKRLHLHWSSLKSGQKLFPRTVTSTTWEKDLRRSKIKERDERGRVLDFHSLRYTFCLLLSKVYPIEIVSKLMRHSSISLTADIYLELGLDRTGEGEWVLQPLHEVVPMPVPDLGVKEIAGGENPATIPLAIPLEGAKKPHAS